MDKLHVDTFTGALRQVKRTPQGGIEVPAYVTRTGIFTYYHADGTKTRELRHPDDVFKTDSLATLKNATVTVDHPPERIVNAMNWKRVSIGHVNSADRVNGSKHDYVKSSVVVQDAESCNRVENKELCEISCGYMCDYDDRPGVWNGEPYDKRQINIRYNHVAIGPQGWGRAGRDVGIKLDSNYPTVMSDVIHVDDAASTLEKPADQKIPVQVLDASQFVSKADHDKLQAKCDSLVAKVAELEKAKTDALDKLSPKALDALVAKRSDVVLAAKTLAGKDFKCDGLSEAEIHLAALKAADPSLKLDGKSTDYIAATFELKVADAQKAGESHKQVREAANPNAKTDSSDKVASARDEMTKRNREAFKAR